MAEVPIPFVDREIDTDDDGTSILVTVGVLIVGFALFAWFQQIGGTLATRLNSFFANMTGFNPSTGDSSGVDVV